MFWWVFFGLFVTCVLVTWLIEGLSVAHGMPEDMRTPLPQHMIVCGVIAMVMTLIVEGLASLI